MPRCHPVHNPQHATSSTYRQTPSDLLLILHFSRAVSPHSSWAELHVPLLHVPLLEAIEPPQEADALAYLYPLQSEPWPHSPIEGINERYVTSH